MSTFRHALLWALAGALVAPLDALHVASGTIVRPPSGALVELPLFAAGGIAVGLLFHSVALPLAQALLRPLRRDRVRVFEVPPKSNADAAFSIGAFVVAYAASSFVGSHTLVAAVLFASLALFSFALVPADKRVVAVLFSIGAAIVGPLVEGTLSSFGAFAYVHTDIAYVPAWLPALYLLTGPAVSFVDAKFVESATKPSRLTTAMRLVQRGSGRLASLRTSPRRRA